MDQLLNLPKISANTARRQFDNKTIVFFVILLSILMLLILASINLISARDNPTYPHTNTPANNARIPLKLKLTCFLPVA